MYNLQKKDIDKINVKIDYINIKIDSTLKIIYKK